MNSTMTRRGLLLPLIVALCACAAPVAAQQLYWIDTNFSSPALNRANVDGTQAMTLALAPGTLPEGLALDNSGGRVYWAEAAWANARIMRAPTTLASTTAIVTGQSCLRGITVAPGSAVYWSSSNLSTGAALSKSTLTGTTQTTLLTLGATANPRGMALDVAGNKLYYADFDQGTIVRANLDGTSATTIVSTGAGSGPYGVVIDLVAQRLYWTEFGSGLLRRCQTDGSLVANVLSGLSNPTYVTLDRASGTLYWIEAAAGGQRIRKASTAGGAVTNYALPLARYGGIVFAPIGTLEAGSAEPVRAVALAPVWPNPSRDEVTIGYALPRASHVRINVADVQGRTVSTLVDGAESAGTHLIQWAGSGARGRLPAGLYFVTMRTGGVALTRRVVLAE